ncbi:MAG: ABC transporter ATP-binding protein [Candidatus Dormibacteraeota bacterium]|uniref:ABC transporter ATP-binding protein n=2 Tax=Candidatus Dormiibacter inghamiae TaxID=3127013 RepID=A0A934NC73_9BACT|nr:ABC transporter ATP-binding protein [Candidatus Dormibacteraeota bacterium]MBJ7606837.1 ABC transporter ATP-binding protein [Candidatus Dormibacteraeota bacterium]
MMLSATDLTRCFGGVVAVNGVSLAVARGALHAVIGPNGAGKSTLFNLIAGLLRPDSGTVALEGRSLDGLSPEARARLGTAIVFQAVRLFRGMTVLENVMVGAHASTHHGFVEAALRLPRHWREEPLIRGRAEQALVRAGLAHLSDRAAQSLPLGQQRAVQVARALCSEPRLLLLDEPASGLRSGEREALARLIEELRAEGLTMLLVEHDVAFVTRLANRITVMDRGRVIAEGEPAQIRQDPAVIAAYLGRPTEAKSVASGG